MRSAACYPALTRPGKSSTEFGAWWWEPGSFSGERCGLWKNPGLAEIPGPPSRGGEKFCFTLLRGRESLQLRNIRPKSGSLGTISMTLVTESLRPQGVSRKNRQVFLRREGLSTNTCRLSFYHLRGSLRSIGVRLIKPSQN